MKKALSVVLAVIMLAMCMPVAFAVDYDVVEELVYEYCRFYDNVGSIYDVEFGSAEENLIMLEYGRLLDETEFGNCDFDSTSEYLEREADKLPVYVNELKAANDAVDAFIKEQGYIRLVSLMNYYHSYFRFAFIVGEENFDSGEDLADYYDYEAYLAAVNAEEEFIEYMDYVNDNRDNLPEDVQQRVDEIMKPFTFFFNSAADCKKNEHIFTAFTDLGDGTHKAECSFCKSGETIEAHIWGGYVEKGDTAVAECEKCDATDTVEGEWVDLPAEDNSNFFTALIATIRDLFENIINFFKNLFG